MEKANIAELKNKLSSYLEKVKRGETVLVMDREKPVARIVPVESPARMGEGEAEAWLKRLEREGVVRTGARKGVPAIWKTVPPGKRPVGAVQALLEERRGR